MPVQGLDALFAPRSVAVFGASSRDGSVGTVVWNNLRTAGYRGSRHAIHPTLRELQGEPVYPSLAEVPECPELGVLCTPPTTVCGIVEDLGRRGAHAAIVLSAGLDSRQREQLLRIHDETGIRILGPNCIGTLAPHAGLNASFAHACASAGTIAFVTQSGALMTSMLDWANARGVGFSRLVSIGDQLDVDCSDLLEFLADDSATEAVLLYLESVSHGPKFLAAAQRAAAKKPVIVVKAGRCDAGRRAAASHTGALAGSDLVFDAAARKVGMLRVESVHDLFLAAEILACMPVDAPPKLTVFTNGGGAGVLAADACALHGVPLAELDPGSIARLDAVLPAHWSRSNPIDILGDAPVPRYVDVLRELLSRDDTGTVLFLHAPTAIVPSAAIATALLPVARVDKGRRGRFLSCWLGDDAVRTARSMFRNAGIADFDTPEQAVRAFSLLQQSRDGRKLLHAPADQASLRRTHEFQQVRHMLQSALAEGREWLLEDESKRVLQLAGIPTVQTRQTNLTPAAAVAAARQVGFPAVLKIRSPDVLHKTDFGGVALDLPDEESVRNAADAMIRRLCAERPDARLLGFNVQLMLRTRNAVELILGASRDPTFGPVILFGHGGVAVELRQDHALALPPLDAAAAEALMARTRVRRVMAGCRGMPGSDCVAVRNALVALSDLLTMVPEIAELDINPLLATEQGCIALDARIRATPAPAHGDEAASARLHPAGRKADQSGPNATPMCPGLAEL